MNFGGYILFFKFIRQYSQISCKSLGTQLNRRLSVIYVGFVTVSLQKLFHLIELHLCCPCFYNSFLIRFFSSISLIMVQFSPRKKNPGCATAWFWFQAETEYSRNNRNYKKNLIIIFFSLMEKFSSESSSKICKIGNINVFSTGDTQFELKKILFYGDYSQSWFL